MTITKEQIEQLAKDEADAAIDYDLMGNPITNSSVMLMGAFRPLVIRLAQRAYDLGAQQREAELLKTDMKPVIWQYRVFENNPGCVDYGTWSEWEEVKPCNPHMQTVQDRVAEFKQYIKDGYGYELRALHPQDQLTAARLQGAEEERDRLNPIVDRDRKSAEDREDQALRERDEYHEMADKLSQGIALHFDGDIGEHSSANSPWDRALDLLDSAACAETMRLSKHFSLGSQQSMEEQPDGTIIPSGPSGPPEAARPALVNQGLLEALKQYGRAGQA